LSLNDFPQRMVFLLGQHSEDFEGVWMVPLNKSRKFRFSFSILPQNHSFHWKMAKDFQR